MNCAKLKESGFYRKKEQSWKSLLGIFALTLMCYITPGESPVLLKLLSVHIQRNALA